MATTCPHGVKAAEFVSSLGSVLAGLALALSAAPVWGADRGLFIPLDAADAALFAPPSVSQAPSRDGQLSEGQAPPNGWLVRVDRRRLFRTIHAVERSGSGRLVLNVAEGLEFEVAADRTERTLSGHSLSGRVVGVAGGAVTFAVHAEAVMGTVWTPGAAYEIAPLRGGVHVVREVDWSAPPPLGEPIRAEGGWGELRPIEQANGDSGAEVDVLVLWTPMTMANTGSEAQMRAGIDLAVAWTNDAYQRSGAEVRLNLVGAEPIDYVEDGDSGIDLGRLSHPSDGFMDEAHDRRDALGADLVSLFTGAGNFAGIANLPGPFSVVLFDADNAYWTGNTFAHELGHNMGLSHDRYIELGSGHQGLLPFSYGYVNKLAFEPGAAEDACWITIMAYLYRCVDGGIESVLEVPHFSTPDQRYPDGEGAPLGVPKSSDEEGADGPADAVRSLNLTYPQVVNFRSGRTDDGDTADAATPVVATSTTFAALADHDDIDYFRIELPEAGWLRAETTGNGDPRGALTAEDGGLVAKDDDSGEGRNFLIEAKLEAGVYFIKVDAGSGTFDYALVVSFNPASTADDHGDGAAEATAAAMPSSTAGELQISSDTDAFRFEVVKRGVVRVGTTGETDVVGTLISEDGTLRLADDDGGPTLNFLIAAKLDPGAYFVEVRGFDDGATGSYSLDISFSPLSAEPDDHADSLDGATDLAVESSASGELEVLLDQDHFRIEVPGTGPGQLWVKSTGNTDVKGALLRRDGGLMNENRFGGGYPNFAVGVRVAPGTYFLRVEGGTASAAGPYELEVSFIADSHSIPLFLSASNAMREGFARIINRDDRPGTVNIHAVDDDGWRFGPVRLSLAAGQTAHFNSDDLEMGNAAKGLSGGVGAGTGDWRLELSTDLGIEALAYVRTSDGFLTSMHEVATHKRPTYFEDMVATFNPAANRRQVSKLRLINPAPGAPATVSNSSYDNGLGGIVRRAHMPATVSISGYDDRGQPSGHVVLGLPAGGASRTLTAQALEAGGEGLQGRLGDGGGKWRLALAAHLPVKVMSLLESPTGHLTNLTSPTARIGREASLPLFISASNPAQQGFVRIINHGGTDAEVTIHAVDGAGRRRSPVMMTLGAGQTAHFNSDDLEMGNAAKGLPGGVGAGEGDWRLELAADIDIQALAYVRTADGLLTSMNALAPMSDGRREVVIFNPASNDRQVSRLRLVNPAEADATITVSGVDDAGDAPPEGGVTLTLPAGAATAITAQQLEAGADHFEGRFGDGKGKWRLFIEADQDVQAMSLLESPTGHITNLSSGTAVR